MTTKTVEREELQEIVRNLPDEKITAAVSFMRKLCIVSDPFYSEANMKHLRAVKTDVQAGLNMQIHDLIEVDND